MFIKLSNNTTPFLQSLTGKGSFHIGGDSFEIETDSRRDVKGKLFVCFKGPNFDGHTFATKALEDGAIGVIVEQEKCLEIPCDQKQFIALVNSTFAFFSKIAHLKRLDLPAKVIAMTGSVGKTSVRSLLECCLQKYGRVFATEGNNNNEIGVPKTILDCPYSADFLILEHGARVLNDIEKLTQISHPDVAILLNAKESHLGPFGNFNNLVQTKKQILSHTRKANVVFADQPEFNDVKQNAITFGASEKSTIQLKEFPRDSKRRFEFRVSGADHPSETVVVEHAYPHGPFGLNLAACLATGKALELPLEKFFENLPNWQSVPGRFHIEPRGSNLLIDDTYNASPSSMLAGLESIKRAYPAKPKVIVLGEMKELGDKSDQHHRDILRFALEELRPNHLWFVGEHAKTLVNSDKALAQKFEGSSSFLTFATTAEIGSTFSDLMKKTNDGVFFLKASRSVGLDTLLS